MEARFFDTTGKRLRLLRDRKGLKQGEVAQAARIRGPYLSELENDKAMPSAEVIGRLADTLDTTTDFLLLRTDDPRQFSMIQHSALEPVYA